jgi:uncharacterized membrane-anchored protein YitT (DUF2179 family)
MRIRSIKENNIYKKIKQKNVLPRYLMLIAGVLLYACGYNLFMLKNNIVSGGIGGVAIIAKGYIDPSLLILVLSVILLIISFIFLGKEKTMASLVGSLLFPLFVYLTSGIGEIITIEHNAP